MAANIKVTKAELDQIRRLPDFDLIMLLSELNDHGWVHAQILLKDIIKALAANEARSD